MAEQEGPQEPSEPAKGLLDEYALVALPALIQAHPTRALDEVARMAFIAARAALKWRESEKDL